MVESSSEWSGNASLSICQIVRLAIVCPLACICLALLLVLFGCSQVFLNLLLCQSHIIHLCKQQIKVFHNLLPMSLLII